MCIVEGNIQNETRERYVGFLHIAILEVSVRRRSPSKKYVVDGGIREEWGSPR